MNILKKTTVFLAVSVFAVTAFFIPSIRALGANPQGTGIEIYNYYDNTQDIFVFNTTQSITQWHSFDRIATIEITPLNPGDNPSYVYLDAFFVSNGQATEIRLGQDYGNGEIEYYHGFTVTQITYTFYIRFVNSPDNVLRSNQIEFGSIHIDVVNNAPELVYTKYFHPFKTAIQNYNKIYVNFDSYGFGLMGRCGVTAIKSNGSERTLEESIAYKGLLDDMINTFKRGQSARDVDDYALGYTDGQSDASTLTTAIPSLFGAVSSFFITVLGGVTLFGISLWDLVIVLLSVALVAVVVKFII